MRQKLICLLLSLFALCFTLPATAQSHPSAVQIASWPQGYAELNDGWRFQEGDDPAWAEPGFDDSSWRAVSLSDKSTAGLGFRWYRLHVRVPEHAGALAVWVDALSGVYELFVNGKPAGDTRVVSPFRIKGPQAKVIPLPQGTNDFEFAVRTRISRDAYSNNRDRPNLVSFLLGTEQSVSILAQKRVVGDFYLNIGTAVAIDVALMFAALAVLGLFLFQRSRREYLWLGLYLGLVGTLDLAFFLSSAGPWPFALNAVFCDPSVYIIGVLQIEFTFAFAMECVGRGWRIYEVLMVITAMIAIPLNLMGGFSTSYFLYEIAAVLIPALGMPILLLIWFRKGNREAGWLILPSLLPGVTIAAFNVGWISRIALHFERLDFLMLPFHLGPLAFMGPDLSYFLFLLAIGVVMFFRFTRVTAAETRSAAELDAAREMQRKLVPAKLPTVEGCTLAASYLPAAEVGGDFYQVLPQPDGSTLIVVGDVSGKGLKAAMTGTFALGALRTLASSNPAPAALLASLNDEIARAEQEGFITMICARIAPNGEIDLANAGHLHPYHNGEELKLESGFPLGVMAGTTYAETHLQLEPGDTLTFLSDGVVEAKTATGELFGFERTQAISSESAWNIAEAARRFGQEDDITVLRLSMSPATVLAG